MNSISPQENQNPAITPSPISRSSGSSAAGSGPNRRTPPPPPKPITSWDNTHKPCSITFVQADPSSFKHVVQMLTGGSAESSSRPESGRNPIPPQKIGPRKDHKSANSKLYERRHSFKNFKMSPLASGTVNARPGLFFGPAGSPEILSPSILDFPSLALSPVTPLTSDPFNRVVFAGCLDMAAEDNAIKEKGFYLHSSPANTPRESEPRLLPLFPVTSPKVTGSSSSAAI